jgi:hypothetical protein
MEVGNKIDTGFAKYFVRLNIKYTTTSKSSKQLDNSISRDSSANFTTGTSRSTIRTYFLKMDSQIFDVLPDPVCIIDLEGKILKSNKSFQRNILKEHYGGFANFLTDIIHSGSKEPFVETIKSVRSGQNPPGGAKFGLLKTLTFSGENQCTRSAI